MEPQGRVRRVLGWLRRVLLGSSEARGGENHLRRIAVGALVLWAFIGTIGTIALTVQRGASTTALRKATTAVVASETAVAAVETQQARQHTQLIEGCTRLNIQRATANGAYGAEYEIDKLFLEAIRSTPRTPKTTARERRLTPRFLAAERGALNVIVWTPLTDCARAVASNGSSYKAPRPVAFAKQLPPPSASSVDNARLLSPVGSVF